METLRDSIDTSITIGIFKDRKTAAEKHIFKYKLIRISLARCNHLNNFNANRLQKTAELAFPVSDRPRGDKDIKSVKYFQKCIQKGLEIPPIWVVKKNRKYYLLDGVHRLVAHYIEGKKFIKCNYFIA